MNKAEKTFTMLIKSTEVRKTDFKKTQYLLDNENLKSKFVKDILCMANAPGKDGYILLGVREEKGRSREVVGISCHHFFPTAKFMCYLLRPRRRKGYWIL